MNQEYSQDIDKVRNNVFLFEILMLFFKLVSHQQNCFQLRSHKKGFQGFSTPPLVF